MTERVCPSCGASLPSGGIYCDYCGSQVVPVSLSIEQRKEVFIFIESMSKAMQTEKARLLRSIDFFYAILWLSGSIILSILWLVFGVIEQGWIYLLAFSIPIAFGWTWVRRRRLVLGLIQFFSKEIDPQVSGLISRVNVPRWQFDQMVTGRLDEVDPLRKFMFSRSKTGRGR